MNTELLEKPIAKQQIEQVRDLILHNDDVNTFDFVIGADVLYKKDTIHFVLLVCK